MKIVERTFERVIRSNTAVSNRILRIYFVAIKEAIEMRYVKKIVWIEGGNR